MRGQIKTDKASKPSKKRINRRIEATSTKTERILMLLCRTTGATVAELSKVTGWQEHSVRGYISGSLKKRKSLNVLSEKDSKGVRRYRITNQVA